MALPEIKVKIGADTSSLEAAMERVKGSLGNVENATKTIGKSLKDAGGATQGLGKRMLPLSAGITAAAGGMFMLAKGTANAGDEIAKSARAAGVSSDALQELRFALGQAAGVGEQQTSTMLTTLTRRMGEAAAGNDTYAAALEGLGVSLEDVESGAVTTDQVFMALTEAMQGADSDAEAAAMGMELLGREGAALGGKLRGADADIAGLRDRAHELGIVLGEDTLKASEEFNDKMDELSKQMSAAKNAIGQALLPVALALATAFQSKVVPAIAAIGDGIAKAIDWFGQLPGPVQEAAGIIGTALGVGGPVLMAIGAVLKVLGTLAFALSPAGAVVVALVAMAAAWAKWGDDIKAFTSSAIDWVIDKFREFVEFVRAIPGQMMEIGKAIIANLIDGIKSGLGELANIGRDIVDGLTSGIRNAAGAAREAAGNLGSTILGGIRSAVRSNSPSLEAMEIGHDIVDGLVIGMNEGGEGPGMESALSRFYDYGATIGDNMRAGIQSTFGMIQGAVSGLGDMVTSGAFDMAKGVVDAMGQMFQGSKPIAAAQALINTFQGMTEALKLPFPANLAAAARVAAQGFAAVKGIQSARPGGGSSIGSAGSAAAAQPAPSQRIIINAQGDTFSRSGIGEIFTQINQGLKAGYEIEGIDFA